MKSRTVISAVLGSAVVVALAGWVGVQYLRSPQGTELRHQIVAMLSAAAEQPHDTAPEAVSGARVKNQLGVNTFLEREADPEKRRRSMQLARDAGIHWVRQQFPWQEIEEAGKGVFIDPKYGKSTWTKYDEIVAVAREFGLELIVRLDTSPPWARPDDNEHFMTPPADLGDYGDYVESVVSRYRGKVRYYQIWNEPNLSVDWGRRPVDAAAATELLREGYTRAKAVDPDVTILAPALAPTISETSEAMNDLVFLQDMYDAGAARYFDIGSVQAYGLRSGPDDRRLGDNDITFSRPVLFREVMVRNGDAAKPIWTSEFGWNVPPLGSIEAPIFGIVSEEQQARYTVRALERAREEWPWMGVMNVWYLRDPTDRPLDILAGFRLLDEDFTPRPVYNAIKEYAAKNGLMGSG